MLTPTEKIKLLQLQEKEKESYEPLTDDEVKAFYLRAKSYSSRSIGQITGLSEFINSLQKPIQEVVDDNIRLLQDFGVLP